jgi:hypothetical protein
MNQQELRNYLDQLVSRLDRENRTMLTARLESLVSVFPFNEYEYILMYLLDNNVIQFSDYEKLRGNYVSSNKYLELYGLAPRIFGQIWGEQHMMDLDTRFKKAERSIDSNYEGEYDLWAEGVRIEVKAARAINTKKRGNLVEKALRYDSTKPFWMNFQQLKPDACDAFIFIGVWVDRIIYWVLSREDAKSNKHLSHQHRGGIEYQIGITDKNITDFDIFKTPTSDIYSKVISIGRTT